MTLLGLLFATWGAAASAQEAPEFTVRGGLPNAFAKAGAGGEVRVAFLGGSITAAEGWRVHTLANLRGAFARATFTEIFAAVPGSGSNYGAARLARDVLQHRPDLLFVEFAVNDGTGSPRVEAQMEGIVRQTWAANPSTDICFVYTISEALLPAFQSGGYPGVVRSMEKVAAHYGIPSFAFGVEVSRRVTAGTLVFTAPRSVSVDAQGNDSAGRLVFTYDKTHPTAAGHQLYAGRLAQALPAFWRAGPAGPHALPAPLAADHW
ncbi:MAG TPA: SGNH/GDSL hydrolase family protein, partial [Opitutaceae bacterium]